MYTIYQFLSTKWSGMRLVFDDDATRSEKRFLSDDLGASNTLICDQAEKQLSRWHWAECQACSHRDDERAHFASDLAHNAGKHEIRYKKKKYARKQKILSVNEAVKLPKRVLQTHCIAAELKSNKTVKLLISTLCEWMYGMCFSVSSCNFSSFGLRDAVSGYLFRRRLVFTAPFLQIEIEWIQIERRSDLGEFNLARHA